MECQWAARCSLRVKAEATLFMAQPSSICAMTFWMPPISMTLQFLPMVLRVYRLINGTTMEAPLEGLSRKTRRFSLGCTKDCGKDWGLPQSITFFHLHAPTLF